MLQSVYQKKQVNGNLSCFQFLTITAKDTVNVYSFMWTYIFLMKYDFISVEELSEQIARCAIQKEVDGIINCCTGEPLSLGEKIESYIKENGYQIKLEYGAFPDRPYDSPAEWGDSTKIEMIMKDVK